MLRSHAKLTRSSWPSSPTASSGSPVTGSRPRQAQMLHFRYCHGSHSHSRCCCCCFCVHFRCRCCCGAGCRCLLVLPRRARGRALLLRTRLLDLASGMCGRWSRGGRIALSSPGARAVATSRGRRRGLSGRRRGGGGALLCGLECVGSGCLSVSTTSVSQSFVQSIFTHSLSRTVLLWCFPESGVERQEEQSQGNSPASCPPSPPPHNPIPPSSHPATGSHCAGKPELRRASCPTRPS